MVHRTPGFQTPLNGPRRRRRTDSGFRNHCVPPSRGEARRRVTGLLYRVLGVVESYADYVAAEDKEAVLNKPFGFVRADLKEHLADADPLKSIAREYRQELGRAGQEVGWL